MAIQDVSVIIPCFNAETWVAAAIESALAQSLPVREIILVDDGSSDGTLGIASKFESQQVCILSQSHRGASAARNRGLAETKGGFIQYLDADDLLHPRKIESQLEMLSRRDPGTVASGRWGRFESDPQRARFVDIPVFRDLSAREFLRLAARHGYMMHPTAWLTPTKVARDAGPWDEDLTLNDDGEYFARVLLASSGIAYCPESVSYYRSGVRGSLSRRTDERAQRSLFRSIELVANHMLRDDSSLESRHAIGELYVRLLHELYPGPRDLIETTTRRICEFGGVITPPPMGPKARFFAGVIGWKATRRVVKFLGR